MICSNTNDMTHYCHRKPICRLNTEVSELTWEPSIESLRPKLGQYSKEVGCDVYAILFFCIIHAWDLCCFWAHKIVNFGDFPGGPGVKTSPSNAGGEGLIPGRGAKIPHASRPKKQNIKQKQHCNKFNEDFKNGPYKKKIFKKSG